MMYNFFQYLKNKGKRPKQDFRSEDTLIKNTSIALGPKLGMEGRDKITGFEGILIGKIEYFTGCNQFGLLPKCDKDGKVQPSEWFDESRIEIIGMGVSLTRVADSENPGGPNRDCPR